MKTYMIILTSLALMWSSCKKEDSPEVKTVDFKHDTYTQGASPSFQLGLEKNEIAASAFGPLVNPFTIESVSFMFGGSNESRDITLHIYKDNGTANPGATVFSKTYTITGSSSMQSLNLSTDNIRFDKGSFRVGIQATAAGAPAIATDEGSIYISNKNWIKVNAFGTWKESSTLSVSGNWIIRASVKEEI